MASAWDQNTGTELLAASNGQPATASFSDNLMSNYADSGGNGWSDVNVGTCDRLNASVLRATFLPVHIPDGALTQTFAP